MRCFYVPKENISSQQVSIKGSELHHITNVLRLRQGDRLTVLDGIGGVYDVILSSLSNKLAVGEIKSYKQFQPPINKITLIQSITKAGSMDMIIQKATEIGVYEIVPVISQYSVPNLSIDRTEKKVIRWRQIAIEASKQSNRIFFPTIHEITEFKNSLAIFQSDLRLIFIAPSIDFITPQNLKSVLRQNNGIKNAQIIIGPEGDFTKEEIDYAISINAIPVSLGENILRAETASISGLAIILYEMSDVSSKI